MLEISHKTTYFKTYARVNYILDTGGHCIDLPNLKKTIQSKHEQYQ